ncbi:hypothetical protein [Rhizobium leguminosarum]|uniref:hypothetical protein n=1 Tax=Rhizobium leguminosarum TaxID=384 RepID=UPI003F9A9055
MRRGDARIALRRILAGFIGPSAGHGHAPMRNGREQSPINKYSAEEWQVVNRGKSASKQVLPAQDADFRLFHQRTVA